MMAALLLAAQAATGNTPATAPVVVTPPGDWTNLPAIPWKAAPRGDDAALSRFVMDEVKAGRCAAAVRGDRIALLRLDLAVLAEPGGQVRAIVPRAIACPTVEQYATGLVSRWTRDNLAGAGTTPTWYRATITFSWAA